MIYLTYTTHAFSQAHTIQQASGEARENVSYSFNNRDYMSIIERKSKPENWKYAFFFAKCEDGWGDLLVWTIISLK